MTKEEFWSKIEITEEEKKQSIHFLKYRGIDEHDHVRQYLESLTGRKVFYSEIATTFRYDKRIRRVLYKYIGLLEESIRAYIANKYNDNQGSINYTSKVSRLLKENKYLFIALSELMLSELVSQTLLLAEIDKESIFPNYIDRMFNLEKDLKALVKLRNEVSHNRFLLDNRKLKSCSIGDGNCTLWANTFNIYNLLPEEYKESFIQEIKECANNASGKLQLVKWSLISLIVVNIDNGD